MRRVARDKAEARLSCTSCRAKEKSSASRRCSAPASTDDQALRTVVHVRQERKQNISVTTISATEPRERRGMVLPSLYRVLSEAASTAGRGAYRQARSGLSSFTERVASYRLIRMRVDASVYRGARRSQSVQQNVVARSICAVTPHAKGSVLAVNFAFRHACAQRCSLRR